jgi:hypothetical protein
MNLAKTTNFELSHYGAMHIVAHLLNAGRHERMFELLDRQDWYHTQYRLLHNNRSFVNDLSIAVEAAKAEGPSGIPRLSPIP